MPRVKLTFSPLSSPEYSRRLFVAKVDEPELRSTLLKSFRDDVAIVTLDDTHGVTFTTQVLDAQGRYILGSDTKFNFYPSTQEVAEEVEPVQIEEPEASQGEGPWVEIQTVSVEEDEDKVATGNDDVPVEEAVDETPVGNPEPPKPAIGSSGNTEPVEPKKEFQVEVRVSDTSVTDPSDAMHATTVPVCGCERPVIKAPVCVIGAGTQRVWTQKYDPDGCRASEWKYRDVPIVDDQTFLKVEDFSNGWGGGSIESVYGYPTMFDNAGDLDMNEVPSMFADQFTGFPDSIFSMDSGPAIFSMEDLFPYGRFETPSVDHGAPHDFYPQVCPEVADFQRVTERSVFSEDYYMFSGFRGPSGGVPPGLRKPVGDSRDINMFGAQSDGSPLRVLTEVDADGAGWQVVKPGRRVVGQLIKQRFTVFSHRGLRAPRFSAWRWIRWLRNRKWEYRIDYDPAAAGMPHMFTIPSEIVAVQQLVVSVAVESPAIAGVEYNVSTDDTLLVPAGGGLGISGQVAINVEQVIRQEVAGAAGVWATAFPKAFGVAPNIVTNASDPTNFSFSGVAAVTPTNANGYITYPPGNTAAGAQPGDGPVEIIARGAPVPFSAGGDIKLKILIMGA